MLRMNKNIFPWIYFGLLSLLRVSIKTIPKSTRGMLNDFFVTKKIATRVIADPQAPRRNLCPLCFQNTFAFSRTSPSEAFFHLANFTIWWQAYLNCKCSRKLFGMREQMNTECKVFYENNFLADICEHFQLFFDCQGVSAFCFWILFRTRKSWCKMEIIIRLVCFGWMFSAIIFLRTFFYFRKALKFSAWHLLCSNKNLLNYNFIPVKSLLCYKAIYKIHQKLFQFKSCLKDIWLKCNQKATTTIFRG